MALEFDGVEALTKKTEMAEKKTEKLYIREFLNKPGFHSTGFIFVEMHPDYGSPLFSLADCNRQVSIDLSLYGGPEARENSLHKIDTIYNAVSKLRKAMKQRAKQMAAKEKQDAIRIAKRRKMAGGNTLDRVIRALDDEMYAPVLKAELPAFKVDVKVEAKAKKAKAKKKTATKKKATRKAA